MALVEQAYDKIDDEIHGLVEEVEVAWGDMQSMRIVETIREICMVFNTLASCFAGIRGQFGRRRAATQPTHQVQGPPALPVVVVQATDGTVMAVPLQFAPPGVMPHPLP